MHRPNRARTVPILLAALLLMGISPQDKRQRIQGFWTPPDGGRIEIASCNDLLCAFIRGEQAGENSTEGKLDGYLLFDNFVYAGEGRWRKGTIYNPRNGKSYKSTLHLLPDGRLRVKGCLWFFCDGQTWKRTE